MNMVTQEAKKRQAVVKLANRRGKSFASRMYGVSLSSVKRWCKRYDGTWRSLAERSHRPKSHPKQHRPDEEEIIRRAFKEKFPRYGLNFRYKTAESLASACTAAVARLFFLVRPKGLEPPTFRTGNRMYVLFRVLQSNGYND